MSIYWHGSPVKIEGYLEPRPTHEFQNNKKYVFAAKQRYISMIFMHRKISGYAVWFTYNKFPTIIELYPRDLEHRYGNVKGYLYEIVDTNKCFYKHPRSSFTSEYVCEKPVKINQTYFYKDVLDELKKYIRVLRYDAVKEYSKNLLQNDSIIPFPKYQNEHFEKTTKDDCVLFLGAHYLYTTIQQALASIFYGPFVIPCIFGNNVTLITMHKFSNVKFHDVDIKIYPLNGHTNLRQNIYYINSEIKPLKTIHISQKTIQSIFKCVKHDKYLLKLISKIK